MYHSLVRAWMTPLPPTISPKESIRRAWTLLHRTPAVELLVLDHGQLVGMLNERDIWHHCPTTTLLMDEQRVAELLEQFRVAAVMALHPPVLEPEASMAEAAQLFAASGREGLAVVEAGELIGFLSAAQFLQAAGLLLSQDVPPVIPKAS